jgi:creatinine amidohydrolase/Fe(II)-dependent formamide hydrolase-like protein
MSFGTIRPYPRRLSDATFPEIEKYLLKTPSLLFPIGSFEPIGNTFPIGMLSRCCEELAVLLSRKTGTMVAPLFQYGFNTPFKAFGGCSGVSSRTFTNSLIECCNGWFFQGFRRILLFTLGMDSDESAAEAAKRLKPTGKKDCRVLVCPLQKNEKFRAFCARKTKMKEHGRTEWGSFALARYFFPDRFDYQGFSPETSTIPDSTSFTQWHKQGRDPQKLRKITPAMRLSGFNGSVSAEEAEEFAEFTLSLLYSDYMRFLSEF